MKHSAEYEAFDALVGKVLSVSREEMKRREEVYRKQADANPHKRGPKRKVKPSALKLVSVKSRTGFDMLTHVILDGALLAAGNDLGADGATALQDGGNDGLAVPTTAMDTAGLHVLVHIPRLAADEGFVALNFTTELAAEVLVLHGKADAVEHKPCGLLGNAKRPVKFPRGNAVAVAGDHPHGREPLVQTERGILKDGPNLDGELGQRVTGAALPYATGSDKSDVRGAATGANHHTIRPTACRKVVDAVVGVRKVLNRLDQSLWGGVCAVHISTLAGVA
jgi:hypothetical protein